MQVQKLSVINLCLTTQALFISLHLTPELRWSLSHSVTEEITESMFCNLLIQAHSAMQSVLVLYSNPGNSSLSAPTEGRQKQT